MLLGQRIICTNLKLKNRHVTITMQRAAPPTCPSDCLIRVLVTLESHVANDFVDFVYLIFQCNMYIYVLKITIELKRTPPPRSLESALVDRLRIHVRAHAAACADVTNVARGIRRPGLIRGGSRGAG